MKAREIMRNDPLFCIPETTLQDVAKVMATEHCGAIPVVQSPSNMRLTGIITDRDITCRAVAQGADPKEAMVGDYMTGEIEAVTPETSIEDCCMVMEENKIRRLPVVDGNKRLCGMVTQAQIARAAPGRLAAEVLKKVSEPSKQESLVGLKR